MFSAKQLIKVILSLLIAFVTGGMAASRPESKRKYELALSARRTIVSRPCGFIPIIPLAHRRGHENRRFVLVAKSSHCKRAGDFLAPKQLYMDHNPNRGRPIENKPQLWRQGIKLKRAVHCRPHLFALPLHVLLTGLGTRSAPANQAYTATLAVWRHRSS